jgi:hypothetical protein
MSKRRSPKKKKKYDVESSELKNQNERFSSNISQKSHNSSRKRKHKKIEHYVEDSNPELQRSVEELPPQSDDVDDVDEKKKLKSFIFTFTLWMSIAQIIVMIIEWSLGGFGTNLSLTFFVFYVVRKTNMGAKYLPYIWCRIHVFLFLLVFFLYYITGFSIHHSHWVAREFISLIFQFIIPVSCFIRQRKILGISQGLVFFSYV